MTTPAFPLYTSVPPANLSAGIQAVVQQALDERRLVEAVVLVARGGTLIHSQAAGWADRENHRKMTVDAIFRLASVSKPIVSAAALVLVAQGRLDLDDGIDRWLPGFLPRLSDGRVARITPRQLLSHTAGLGYRFFEADPDGPYARAGVSDGMDASGISLAENLRRIASVPLLYEPGTAWGYSLATDVLGALIEQVHGAPLEAAVRQLVTGPLGMTDTGFLVQDAQRVATAYANGAPQPHPLVEGETVSPFDAAIGIPYSPARIFDPQAFPSGGAGMAGTAEDLLRLLEALRQGGRCATARRIDCGDGSRSDGGFGTTQRTGLRLWTGVLGLARPGTGRFTGVAGHLAVGRRLRPCLVRGSGTAAQRRRLHQHLV